jgi:thiosulfate reductase cytochrome b subunit
MYHHYPLYIRLWHLLNALFFLCLILTGLNMMYSNPDHPFISLPVSAELHKICGIGLTASYLIFFTGNIITGNGKNYLIRFKNLSKNLIIQIRYYIRRSWQKPEPPFPISSDRKFNPLQALAYSIAMYIGIPLLFLTGLGLMFPGVVVNKILGISGLLLTDLVHVIAGFLMAVFMIVHIYMSTLGKTPFSNFRAIITGWQQGDKEKD